MKTERVTLLTSQARKSLRDGLAEADAVLAELRAKRAEGPPAGR